MELLFLSALNRSLCKKKKKRYKRFHPESSEGSRSKIMILHHVHDDNTDRWSGKTRNWDRIEEVKLNWLKGVEMESTSDSRKLAA